MSWSEKEVRAAVAAYFRLLRAEQDGERVNKTEVYRSLASRFPRTAKAFELKFQNISAILLEQRLPYCDGLKPRGNYQRLLKLVVLDHLDRSPLPPVEPHEILFSKLRSLGPLQVTARGSGRFGRTIEDALGIASNSSKDADFMGIELKTKHDKSLQTLFSRVPDRYVALGGKQAFFGRHSYYDDQRQRQALYTSFSSRPDSLGFSLRVKGNTIAVFRSGVATLEYEAETLEAALLSKHMQTAFISIVSTRERGREVCSVDSVTFCKWPSILRFLELTSAGEIFLDLTLSGARGKLRDHGFLWRIRSESIDRLYLSSVSVDLGSAPEGAPDCRARSGLS